MNNLPTGVVEDVNDPEQLGRVRVRFHNLHTGDANEIPTEALPWSSVLMPVTSPSIGGIGRSATGLLPGSWVIGSTRLGADDQDMLIIGSIPGKTSLPTGGRTFSDPNGTYPLRTGRDLPAAADTNSHRESALWNRKTALATKDIVKSMAPELKTIDPRRPAPPERGKWAPPTHKDTIAPVYPHNHVTHTSSGHIIEIDDTPGYERLSTMHRSGTLEETVANGDRSITIVGSRFTIIMGSDNVFIKGDCNLTVEGNVHTFVKGNYHLEVDGDYSENIKGSKLQKIGGSHLSEISGEVASNIKAARKVAVGDNDTLHTAGDTELVLAGNRKSTVGGDNSDAITGNSKIVTCGDLMVATGGTSSEASAGGMSKEAPIIAVLAEDSMELTSTDIAVKGTATTIEGTSLTTTAATTSINGASIALVAPAISSSTNIVGACG
jgi:hypothetical protein